MTFLILAGATMNYEIARDKQQWYLDKISEDGTISRSLVDRAMETWDWLIKGGLDDPDCHLGEAGEVCFTWNDDGHYVSLVVTEQGAGEWFYQRV